MYKKDVNNTSNVSKVDKIITGSTNSYINSSRTLKLLRIRE